VLPLLIALAAFQDPEPEVTLDLLLGPELGGRAHAHGSAEGFNRFSIGTDLSFELSLRLMDVRENETGGCYFARFGGLIFGGETVLSAPLVYGGATYPAGSRIESSGRWISAEFGGGWIFPVAEAFRPWFAFSLGAHSLILDQTGESIEFFSLLAGIRAGIVFAPVPVFRIELEAGISGGGKDWWLVPALFVVALGGGGSSPDYEGGGIWSAEAAAFATYRPLPFLALRVGYRWRAIETSSSNREASLAEDNLNLQIHGPSAGVEIRF
jgi:hypothetical protein